MTKKLILALYILLAAASHAQESNSVFNFLEMPVSAHSTALGGRNISLIEDDASLVFSNPALLSSVSDKTLNLNFMTYLQGCNVGSAAFVKILGERSTMGVTAQYAHYGTMDEITADNVTVGSFSAMDMALSGMYAYNLNDRWAGGATGKFIYSKYGDYSSVALAVDLGVNYYNENTDFSLSAVARNLGGQVKAFGEIHEKLPFSMQIGFTKGFDHAPFRVSVTLVDLTRWDKDYYFASGEELSTGKMLMNHLAAGVDFLPTDYMYLSLGYNFRKAKEMNINGSQFIGLHLEGPYFSPKQCGAQDPNFLKKPQAEEYNAILEASKDIIRWSVAPELEGALALGQTLQQHHILPSIAHTDAIYEEVEKAFTAGYTHVTHLYSAMSSVTRKNAFRYAGVVEATYLIEDMTVEIIADGIHLPKPLLQFVYKFKGVDKTALCTDAMRGAGMPDGESILGSLNNGQKVIIEDGVAKMPDRKAFAGSVATTDRLVRTMIYLAGVPLIDAVRMMSLTPARILHIDKEKGSLEIGKDADIVIFDNQININNTILKGHVIYTK